MTAPPQKWRFMRIPCVGEGITGFENKEFHTGWTLHQDRKDEEGLPTTVPGNVQWTLQQHGIIPDPFIGQQNEQCKWVATHEWWYRNTLDLAPWITAILKKYPNGGVLHLIFDAIDYDATFYLDSHHICRQTGMFSPTDLACMISPSSDQNPTRIPIDIQFHEQPFWRQHALKCQMAFGWDFAPEIRTVGIWKPVRVSVTGPAFFSEVWAHAEKGGVRISGVITDITGLSGLQTAELQITVNKEQKRVSFSFESGKAFNVFFPAIEIPLWHPWSLGSPTCVPITIQLFMAGQPFDEYRGVVVNRTVSWGRNPGTFPKHYNWTCIVNGQKLFLRGMNWVPPDSYFGRIDEVRYEKLLKYARDMNTDILRVWGGGIEEKSAFYEICDREGIMIWQEYPYACTNYPRDPRYMKIATAECRAMTRSTRRHPSVVVYCGGNEFNPFINKHIIEMVTQAVKDYTPDLHCFAASPFLGDDHNWKVWGARRMLEGYDNNGRGPFQMLTEFGMQAMPDLETLKMCAGELWTDASVPLEEIDKPLQYHRADTNGYRQYAEKCGLHPKSVADYQKFTQSLQAYALKYAVETCRAAWPHVSGVFPWQFSDPWPNSSWSVVDYNYHPKRSYGMMKQVFAPVLPMIRYQWNGKNLTGSIIIQNCTQTPFTGQITVESNTSIPDLPAPFQKMCIIKPDRPLCVKKFDLIPHSGMKLHLSLADPTGHVVATNFSLPMMERPATKLIRIKDLIDVRFDSWWRMRLTKLMELDRIKTDAQDYPKRKAEIEKTRK
jgi:beta-mannosidase